MFVFYSDIIPLPWGFLLFTRTVYFYRGKNVCCFLGYYTSSAGKFFVIYTDGIFLPRGFCCLHGRYFSTVGVFVVYTDGIFLPWGFFVVYTDGIFLPRGISPLRSDCRPRFGRNDIIKPVVHNVISSDSREIPYNRDGNSRIRYAAGRGRPALPTATPRIGHNVISSVSQEVSLREKRNFTHSRQLARGGSPPSEANRVANEGNKT